MRICPKCGYTDLPIWRFAKYKRFTSYCRADELENWDAKLLAKIPLNRIVIEIDGYRYQRKKSGYIERIHRLDCMYPSQLKMNEPPMEHWREGLRRRELKNQTKLLVI